MATTKKPQQSGKSKAQSGKQVPRYRFEVPGLVPVITHDPDEAGQVMARQRFRKTFPGEECKLTSLLVEEVPGTAEHRIRSFFSTGPNGAGVSFTIRMTSTKA
jgi:hypothetical protein